MKTKKQKAISQWLVFDTEDNALTGSGRQKKLLQWCAKDYRGKEFEGTDCESFLNLLTRYEKPKAWAHNCQYDLGNFFGDSLDELDWILAGGKFIKSRFDGVEFLDTCNLIQLPLEDIAKEFDLEKKPFSDLRAKCRQDVEILYRLIKFYHGFAADHGAAPRNTAGGLALEIWKESGGENWQDGYYLSQEAYMGARSELFNFGGEGRIMYCDINSLYPWAASQPMPDEISMGGDIDRDGIISCRMSVPECEFAPLPVRNYEGQILYPCGRFNGVWTCYEVREAIKRGAKIEKVFEIQTAKTKSDYYGNFVRSIYEERRNASGAKKLFLKNVLNAFCGQIGMSGEISRSVNLADHFDKQGLVFGSKLLMDCRIPIPDHVNYCHAAHINSYSRVRLLEFMEKIGYQDMIFCHTDAVVFFCENEPPFKISDELGEMKLEGIADKVFCRCEGVYQFGDEFKAKGIRRDHASEYIVDGVAEFDSPYNIREAIEFYDSDNSRKLGCWRKIIKKAKDNYSKKDVTDYFYYPKKVNFRKYYSKLELTRNDIYHNLR